MRSALAAWLVFAAPSLILGQGSANAFVVKIPAASMASSANFAMGSGSASPGQTVGLSINLTSAGTAAPAAFQVDVNFDAQKLTLASASAGTELIAANQSLSATALPNGGVRLSAGGPGRPAIANGSAATLSFTVNPWFVSGSSAIGLVNCMSWDSLGNPLSAGCSGGTMNVFSCDLNNDGAVSVADVQMIVNEALGAAPAVHDLNHDGVVNVADVQKEINAVTGLGCAY